MDHFNYTTNLGREEQFDASDECYYTVDDTVNCKYGDELLIDLVRSRPYLYDKTQREYKDTKLKENAWREMASILNMTVSDCQTRWTRLRQRFSKERMLHEQETRSGAGKPTRPKWFLLENLNFLEKHMVHRKSITNMSFSQSSILKLHQAKRINQDFRVQEATLSKRTLCIRTPSPLQQQPQLSSLTIKQVDDNLILASTDIFSDTQPAPVLPPPSETPPPSQQSIASTQRSNASERSAVSSPQRSITLSSEQSAASSSSTTSSLPRSTAFPFQQSMPSDSDSEILSPPSCFMGNKKPVKRQKIDLVENAFSQINTTLSTMASRVYSKKNPTPDDDDPDVLIGKLVTAELKKDS